ncbi:MAG: AAA family ATPase [Blastocatellia bacterium]
MLAETSPFTPGQTVPLEFFVGRIAEIERLRGMVRAAAQGRLKVGFVAGERGIGKSSLASFVHQLCEREDAIAGAHVFLGGSNNITDMARRTFDHVLKESIDKPWSEKVREFFGDHVRKVGLFGISIEFNVKPEELAALAQNFILSLRQLLNQIKDERKGLLLIFDDINGLADSAEFANWLKSTVDEITTTNKPFPVCWLMVGLEERRQSLIKLQPSLARVFDIIDIRPWDAKETAEFYQQTFQRNAAIKINDDALQSMVGFTGGLPVIAHEIGDAVWRTATASPITLQDAMRGVFIAAEFIGRKFLQPQISQALRSPRYRSILHKIAGDSSLNISFQRGDVGKRLTAEEKKVLDNFLNRMKELGALVPDSTEGPGGYRFINQLYRLYFHIESLRKNAN